MPTIAPKIHAGASLNNVKEAAPPMKKKATSGKKPFVPGGGVQMPSLPQVEGKATEASSIQDSSSAPAPAPNTQPKHSATESTENAGSGERLPGGDVTLLLDEVLPATSHGLSGEGCKAAFGTPDGGATLDMPILAGVDGLAPVVAEVTDRCSTASSAACLVTVSVAEVAGNPHVSVDISPKRRMRTLSTGLGGRVQVGLYIDEGDGTAESAACTLRLFVVGDSGPLPPSQLGEAPPTNSLPTGPGAKGTTKPGPKPPPVSSREVRLKARAAKVRADAAAAAATKPKQLPQAKQIMARIMSVGQPTSLTYPTRKSVAPASKVWPPREPPGSHLYSLTGMYEALQFAAGEEGRGMSPSRSSYGSAVRNMGRGSATGDTGNFQGEESSTFLTAVPPFESDANPGSHPPPPLLPGLSIQHHRRLSEMSNGGPYQGQAPPGSGTPSGTKTHLQVTMAPGVGAEQHGYGVTVDRTSVTFSPFPVHGAASADAIGPQRSQTVAFPPDLGLAMASTETSLLAVQLGLGADGPVPASRGSEKGKGKLKRAKASASPLVETDIEVLVRGGIPGIAKVPPGVDLNPTGARCGASKGGLGSTSKLNSLASKRFGRDSTQAPESDTEGWDPYDWTTADLASRSVRPATAIARMSYVQ
eukprot:gene29431-5777_t